MLAVHRDIVRRAQVKYARESRHFSVEKIVLCAAMIANILSMLVFAIISTVYIRGLHYMENISPNRSSSIFCIACVKLHKWYYPSLRRDSFISSTIVNFDDAVQMCCAHASGQMSFILEQSLQKQEIKSVFLPEYDPKNFSFSSVSAHKRLYPSVVMSDLAVPLFEANKMVTTHLKVENDISMEHVRGVDVLEDGFHICHSGMYLVYSSIHFRPESVYPCKNFTFQTWGHVVERISQHSREPLGHILKTAHTCCDQCTADDETSFTSGMFYLRSGDIIRVSVSGHGLIYFRQQSSYAGLMMAGGENKIGTDN